MIDIIFKKFSIFLDRKLKKKKRIYLNRKCLFFISFLYHNFKTLTKVIYDKIK